MKKVTLIFCTLAYMLICTSSASAQWQKTNGPYGGTANCLIVKDTDIFAGTADGVFISANKGASWTAINNGMPSNDFPITSLAIIDTNIFAATSNDGVFLSTNNGASWTAVNNGLPVNTGVQELAVNGTNIFAGGPEGVFLSNNNGVSWTAVNNGLPFNDHAYPQVTTLAVSETSVLVGIEDYLEEGELFLSIDSGASWNSVGSGLPDFVLFVALGVSGSNIFVSDYANGIPELYNDLFLSSNQGSSWTSVSSGLPLNCLVYSFAENGNNIFVGTNEGVFFHTSGITWIAASNGLTDSTILSLVISGTDIFAGDDSGIVWKRSLSDILGVQNITADNNSITIYPNPATNQLTIHTTSFHNEAVMVSIMNVLGQVVSPPMALQRSGEDATIYIGGLSAGIYFLQMKWESGSVVKMFVKE